MFNQKQTYFLNQIQAHLQDFKFKKYSNNLNK